MLSTSTFTSSSTSNFGFGVPPSTTSQYSAKSNMKSSQHPLTDLLEVETTYLKTLKVIDSQLAPLWMKQTTQAAPDFTELLKYASDIFFVNKRFNQKLVKFAGNAQAPQELSNLLIHWVHDMEIPYTNYSRCYISNLNQRYDILANESIKSLLKNLSQSSLHDITLELLFDAPIQQLKYYHGLYNRLSESIESNRTDFEYLVQITRRLEGILNISQKSSATSDTPSLDNSSIMQQVLQKKNNILQQDDISSYYTNTGEVSLLESADGDASLDGYGSSLVLDEYDDTKIGNSGKQVPSGDDDGDLFNIQPRTVKILDTVPTMPNVTDTAITVTSSAKNEVSSQVQLAFIQPKIAMVQKLDDETIDYNQSLETTTTKDDIKSIDTTATTRDNSPVTPTQIKLPTPVSATSISSQRTLSPVTGDSPRPVSPRAIQVKQAVTPVAAMQAVSQKTNDYLSNSSTNNPGTRLTTMYKDRTFGITTHLPERSSSSAPGATLLPRTSSKKEMALTMESPDRTIQQNTSPIIPSGNTSLVAARSNHHGPISNTSGLSHQQQSIPSAQQPLSRLNNKNNNSQRMQTSSLSNQQAASPLLRTSSINSTTQQLYGPVPGSPLPRTGTPANQQHLPASSQKQTGNGSPSLQPSTYQQSRTTPLMDDQQNQVRQVLYSNNRCEVFHWKGNSWYAVDGQCTLQVRLTYGGRSCLAVQLQTSGQVYLNAWIVPSMVISQPSPTDISISVNMASQQENYLIHFGHPADASNLLAMLHRMHHESSNQPQPFSSSSTPPSSSSSSTQQQQQRHRPETKAVELRDETPSVEDVPQTLKHVFQCKCKLFVQNETSKWNPIKSTAMRISQQLPSQKIHVYIEDDKNTLISSIVRSGNVERLTNKRITFLLSNDNEKSSMVYLIQLKDEQTGNKVFDYLKTQNAAQGW
ncbi:hypothetical protein BC941DRAFT_430037 [Chlamydoabsidia padenii]|nr:hypothetical protein BC941DRAFT_430037 [Chlamydoabsidia padenii]